MMPGDQWEYDFRLEHEHPLESLQEVPLRALNSGQIAQYVDVLQQRNEQLNRSAGPFMLADLQQSKLAGETEAGWSVTPVAEIADRESMHADSAGAEQEQGALGRFKCGCSHPARKASLVEKQEQAVQPALVATSVRAGGLQLNEPEIPLPEYLRTLSDLCQRAAERLKEATDSYGAGVSRLNAVEEAELWTEVTERSTASAADESRAPGIEGETLAMDGTNVSLNTCANAAANDPAVTELSSMVADLTGNSPGVPFTGHNQDEMLFVGSLAKIYPMYAAFTLRRMVEAEAKKMIAAGLSTTTTGWELKVFAELRKTLQPRLKAAFPGFPENFPALANMFWLSDAGDASFVEQVPLLTDAALDRVGEFGAPVGKFHDWMRLMLRWSNNTAASHVILALGYAMINFALETGGFFNRGTNRGLWMSGDYHGHDWVPGPGNRAGKALDARWAKLQRRAKSNFTGTAFQVARLMALLGKGKLVDASSSATMINIMTAANGGISSYIGNGLAAAGRGFSKVTSKIGFGDESFSHDCALVRVDRADGTANLFVAVILGSPPSKNRRGLKQLAVAYYDCVIGLHP